MDRVEELIRESLKARAQDVEPTPMLWLEVDRRVSRRKRFQAVTWSLAGATAVLAGVLGVPAILDLVTDDRPDIDIQPVDVLPAGGVLPEFYVTDVDGSLEIRDLTTGDRLTPEVTADDGRFADAVDDLAVRPGSTRDGGAVAAIRGSGTGSPYLEVAETGPADGDRVWIQSLAHALADENALRGFRPSVTWTPDQDLVAFTMPETDQAKLVLWEPGATEGDGPVDSRMVTTEPALVFGVGDVELLDWFGRTTTTGDESVLVFRDDLGVHLQPLTVADDGSMTPGEGRVLEGVTDLAGSHVLPGSLESPDYAIADGADGAVLRWSADGDRSGEISLTGAFGDVDPATLWLDAKQDAALVGDGNRTFLYAHDGSGHFVPAIEVQVDGWAALYDAVRPGEPTPEPEPTGEPTTDPGPEPEPAPTETDAEPAPGVGAALPEPVVTATIKDLVLHGPDGEQVLYTLPDEGESSFRSVAVRPGSTVDDLTIVGLHLAEGGHDFRTYRFVDGELSVEYWDRQDLQPGFGGGAGDGVAAFGPVWHPAGDKLAWIEMGTGGMPHLRIIGWTDAGPGTGDTADDNASWPLEQYEGVALEPVDWVEIDGPVRTGIRAVAEDATTEWVAIPIEIQGDNAPALTGTGERRPTGGDGPVFGLAGTLDDGAPRWMLKGTVVVFDPMGEARTVANVPDEFFPGEGIPDVWMRAAGGGYVVGISNTGVAYYGSLEDELSRVGGDGIMDGDVVN
ncbi:hypothetical protein [Egicoccus sp. AB-alg6-2]|uniref:hypothetical protein n=1 Tax=Egicoccus sp. AB-alg6-2 TaxID=3242692 RepID=UPI00359E8CEF